MSVKLVGRQDSTICVNDMEDGQLAEIVEWTFSGAINRVVQRYGSVLITIGCHAGYTFDTVLDKRDERCRVRLLKPGEMIEVVENEGAN